MRLILVGSASMRCIDDLGLNVRTARFDDGRNNNHQLGWREEAVWMECVGLVRRT